MDNLLHEKHNGGLEGNFGSDKTFSQLSVDYFWPIMRTNDEKFLKRCKIYQNSNGKHPTTELYHPLPIPDRSWDVVSIDFF